MKATTCSTTYSAGPRLLLTIGLTCALLFLGACGGEEEPTPTPSPAPLSLPVVAAVPDSPLPTATTPAAPATPVVADSQPVETAQTTVTATVATNGPTAVFVPLEVDEGVDCEIEPHIDLSGYPDLDVLMGCPIGDASLSPVAINEFGEGPDYNRFMLWFSTENLIYVLWPDNTYETYPDTWDEGQPTYACNPTDGETDSPPLPRRGFGKLWCDNPEIQETLGLVEREERLCQYSVVQPFEEGRLLACFEDATIRYFRLLDGGAWDVVVQ